MKVTCLACRHGYDVPEGTDVRRLACPACKAPQAANFLYERSVRFEAVDDPSYAALCEAVRAGRLDEAFALLPAVDRERAADDPALAPLRADPRWRSRP
jgi:hypothetical protein